MKAIKYFACIVLLALTSRIYSQIPDTIWTKTFGGSLADVGNSVKQTNDCGFIVAGTTSSFGAGGQDIWLIKTDENGDTLWTKTFGGTGNDRVANVVQTNDNGYAVFGTTNSFGNGGDDFLLWKTDSLGNTKWFKTYGETIDEITTDGKQTFDGGFIICGYFYSQVYKTRVVKVDESGNETWNNIYYYSIYLRGMSIEQTIDSEYVLGCNWDFYYFNTLVNAWRIYKLSVYGDVLYTQDYGFYYNDFIKVVKNTKDNNVILGGTCIGLITKLCKIHLVGGTIWSRTVSAQTDILLTALEPTMDNGFILTAYSYERDIVLLKTDENGITEWEKRIEGNGFDDAYSVYPTNDDGFVLSGKTNSLGAGDFDIWLLKFKYNPSPEIQISKDSLNLTFDDISFTSRDSLVIYNTGNATLNIDTIYSTNASGFVLDIVLKDTTIHSAVTWRNNYYYPFEIEPGDSAKLIFTYPLWIPKSLKTTETWVDTVIILNNTLNNGSLAIPTVIDFPVEISNESNNLPLKFSLSQNYPNPFNPSTVISYQLPVTSNVTLKIYDVLGNEIATLVNEEKQPGIYQVEFSPESSIKYPASGIYFYQLLVSALQSKDGKAGNYIETKKMVLMK